MTKKDIADLLQGSMDNINKVLNHFNQDGEPKGSEVKSTMNQDMPDKIPSKANSQ